MRFYTRQHRHYCGIDLHARTMYLCVLDASGGVLLHKNVRSCPEEFLAAVAPFRDDLVVAVECIFTWYWLADLCAEENICGPKGKFQDDRQAYVPQPVAARRCTSSSSLEPR
jgi:hypothetical protein